MNEVTEHSMSILSRRRGRPRSEPTEPVMTRLPLHLYDQIVKTANRRGESVSSVVRSLLTVRIREFR